MTQVSSLEKALLQGGECNNRVFTEGIAFMCISAFIILVGMFAALMWFSDIGKPPEKEQTPVDAWGENDSAEKTEDDSGTGYAMKAKANAIAQMANSKGKSASGTSNNLDLPKVPPSLEVSKQHYQDTACVDHETDKRFSVLGTTIKDLSQFGVGMELYFTWMKGLYVCFTLMTLVTLPIMWFFYSGTYLKQQSSVPREGLTGAFVRVTLSNFGTWKPGAAELTGDQTCNEDLRANFPTTYASRCTIQIGCKIFEIPDLTMLLGILDIASIVILTAFTLWFRWWVIPRRVEQSGLKQVTPADYTVRISGLPLRLTEESHPDYEDILQGHLESVVNAQREEGECDVVDVAAIRNYRGGLFSAKEQAQVQHKINYYRDLGVSEDDKKMKKLTERLEKLHQKVMKSGKDMEERDRSVLGAYVTFDDKRDVIRLMHAYRWSNLSLGRLFQPRSLRFHGGRLKVEIAAEPSNVLWENADIGTCERWGRWSFITIIVVLFLLGAATINVLMESEKKIVMDEQAAQTCSMDALSSACSEDDLKTGVCAVDDPPDTVDANGNVVETFTRRRLNELQRDVNAGVRMLEDTTEWVDAEMQSDVVDRIAEESCECRIMDAAELAENTISGGKCEQYAKDQLWMNFITSSASAVTVIVNVVIKFLMLVLVKYERPRSVSARDASLMVKIAVAQFLNLCIIDIIFNMKLSFLPDRWRLGDYAVQDYFVIEWYSLVGVSFIMTAFYNVLMLPGFAFGFHILGVLRRAMSRCCCRPKHQDDLNAIWTLPYFRLSDRYAQCLAMVLVVVTFSAGMPILTPICAAFFFIGYWTDKFILLKGSSRPPHVDESTALQSVRFLFFAIILHCLMGTQMLGNQQAFPSEQLFGTESDLLGFINQFSVTDIHNNSESGILSLAEDDVSPFWTTILKRFFTSATFGYTVILIACVVLGFLYFFARYCLGSTVGSLLRFCCGCFCDSQLQTEDASDPALRTTFRVMEKSMKKHKIVTSYNPRYNPQYAGFVMAMDQRGTECKKASNPAIPSQAPDQFYKADGMFLTDM